MVTKLTIQILKVADTTLDFEQSLALMKVAQKELNSANLDMTIAKTQLKLWQEADAKATLNQ